MRALVVACLLMPAVAPACLTRAQTPGNGDGFTNLEAVFQEHHSSGTAADALTIDEIERIALAVNPDIEVAARRVAIAQAHVPSAGALDDPMAMYRAWGVPLSQPWNYNAAQNMFSISQTLPGRGKLALRSSVAESSVTEARTELDRVRLEVRVRARKAFDDLLRAQDEIRIHDEHVGVARQAIQAARIKYAVGKVPQQDMLKAEVALTRVAEEMIRVDEDADLARARLNTLLDRKPAAPLSVRGEHAVAAALPTVQALQDLAVASRPDLAGARAAVERSHKEQALAKTAYIPDLTVSAGYMLQPAGSSFRNNYMLEGSVNLPWLNHRKHDAEIGEASARVTEQDAESAAMRNAAFGEIQEALVETEAAQKLVRMYRDQLRPQAEATLESSVIAYENGKTDFLDLLDSQMTVIDIDLSLLQATANFDTHLADLELATGASFDEFQKPAAPEAKP
jgi:cobalt-zinc-cadmium efflux system outer membrane protein